MSLRFHSLLFSGLFFASTALLAKNISLQFRGEVHVTEAQTAPPSQALENKDQRVYLIQYIIYIKNISGSAIKLPTGGFKQVPEFGPNYTKMKILWDFDYKQDDTPIIASESDLKTVILHPGDLTAVFVTDTERNLTRLSNITISYEVAEKFGARYGLLTGEFNPTVKVFGLPK